MKKLSWVLVFIFVCCWGIVCAQAEAFSSRESTWLDAYRLGEVSPPSDDPRCYVEDGVLFAKDILLAYPNNKTDSEYIIPEGILYIAECAFMDNQHIVKVVIPDSVIKIGDGAFEGCRSLVDVNLPPNLFVIGGRAFLGTHALKSITLPSRLCAIGEQAFSETGLTEIRIPASVKYIGSEQFAYTHIQTIHFEDDLVYCGGVLLDGSPEECTLTIYAPSLMYDYIQTLMMRFSYDGDNAVFVRSGPGLTMQGSDNCF